MSMDLICAMVTTAYFKFGAKSQMRLEADSNILLFYKTVGRAITNAIIQWGPIIKYFKLYWDIMVKRKGDDVSDVPKIIKFSPNIKWTEYFTNFTYHNSG